MLEKSLSVYVLCLFLCVAHICRYIGRNFTVSFQPLTLTTRFSVNFPLSPRNETFEWNFPLRVLVRFFTLAMSILFLFCLVGKCWENPPCFCFLVLYVFTLVLCSCGCKIFSLRWRRFYYFPAFLFPEQPRRVFHRFPRARAIKKYI